MSPDETTSLPPVSLDRDDMEELKEIILEFLGLYTGVYEKRIQKLIFYSEIVTAELTGNRLTDASFAPYKFGPYSKAVKEALDELKKENRISIREDGQFEANQASEELSPKKRYLIRKIHEETKRMSTEELVDRAKDTWLWKEFEHAEEMDFAAYIDEVIMSPEERIAIDVPDRDPVDEADLDRLLT